MTESVSATNHPDKVTIVIADDHRLFRHALKSIVGQREDFTIVGEAGDADTAVALVRSTAPTILMLDLGLPGKNGLEVILELVKGNSETRIVVVSQFDEEGTVRQAFAAGAKGYVLKNSNPDQLLTAIDKVAAGDVFVPREFEGLTEELANLRSKRRGRALATDPLAVLSKREREVFYLLAEGMPNRDIAKRFFISPRTVETHRARVIKKLGCQSTADLIRYAVRHNLLRA